MIVKVTGGEKIGKRFGIQEVSARLRSILYYDLPPRFLDLQYFEHVPLDP